MTEADEFLRIGQEIGFELNLSMTEEQARELATRIAVALSKERRRCAKIAKAYVEDILDCSVELDDPENIATAILENAAGVANDN
jgi:hypothetical protein